MGYRIIPPHHVVEVTISIEQGLLMAANPLVKLFIEAAMARAQKLYPVVICHYLVEDTHIHLILVVHDPCDVRDFVGRFKTETAHYLNGMLGRKKRTVWCESFFCAPILTPSSVRSKISYIYTNPAKDGLEDSIDNYPNLSSWQAYRSGRHRKRLPRVYRTVVPYMPDKAYPEHRYRREVKRVKQLCRKESHLLELQPDAWMDVFRIPEEERAEQNQKTMKLIRYEEAEFREQRKKAGKSVIGAFALRSKHLECDYLPDRKGKQMWCISDDKDLRIRYIEWARAIKEKARAVYERWKEGDFTEAYPPGVFAPSRPLLANMAPLAYQY